MDTATEQVMTLKVRGDAAQQLQEMAEKGLQGPRDVMQRKASRMFNKVRQAGCSSVGQY
ncbi:hypothetical protein [Synechococcus sp. CC9605]|uniref:hypothetical protein n=1 Tax=Synechococcus sp. (strain CC9605) TaxID=110662 RepID=UPI0021533189|nr:hypothetical protein [Synechococcus sp. CC9605]